MKSLKIESDITIQFLHNYYISERIPVMCRVLSIKYQFRLY
jgi:hypothetical protein